MSLILLFAGGPTGPIQGTLSIIETDDGLAASCSLPVSGSGGSIELDDVATVAGVLIITAQVFVNEADDTGIANGALPITGLAAASEDDDVPSLGGTIAVVGSTACAEEDDSFSAQGAASIAASSAATEEDDTLTVSAFMPIWHPRRGGDDEWARCEQRQIEWEQQLRQIIDRSWQIANGEIDPITFLPIPAPDHSAVIDELMRQTLALDRARIDAFIAEQEQRQEEEAISILLLAE